MKKVLALVLALVLVLSLVACGGTKDIALTLENYEKYINISAYFTEPFEDCVDIHLITSGQKGIYTGDNSYSWMLYKGFDGGVYASAISQNFNYNDIKIEGTIKGSYDAYTMDIPVVKDKTIDFEQKFSFDCNIAGEGGQEFRIDIPNGYGSLQDFIKYDIEISSISGSVSPVG